MRPQSPAPFPVGLSSPTLAAVRRGRAAALTLLLPLAGCSLLMQFEERDGGGGPVCGNGVQEGDEACDGDDLGGLACEDVGYGGGTLRCSDSCTLDESGCEPEAQCGNGLKEAGEACDGQDFGGSTCVDLLPGAYGGTLTCDAQCQIHTDSCEYCGDGIVQASEECEPGNTAPCRSVGGSGPGTASCTNDCRWDRRGCFECGDGRCDIEFGEDVAQCPTECGWLHISAGPTHTCGVRNDGTAWCWGRATSGALGSAGIQQSEQPVRVETSENWLQIETGGETAQPSEAFTCGISSNRDLHCWGAAGSSRLGNGAQAPTSDIGPPILSDVLDVALGRDFGCAVQDPGTLLCWGSFYIGRTGTGWQTADVTIPTAVDLDASDFVDVDAGREFACALTANQQLYCWGSNVRNETGVTVGSSEIWSPTWVADDVLSFACGAMHSCFSQDTDSNGIPDAVFCSGPTELGRLGVPQQGTPPSYNDLALAAWDSVPWQLGNGFSFSLGWAHSCALAESGSVYCWGDNAYGQSGLNGGCAPGAFTDQVTVSVRNNSGGPLANIISLSAGSNHTCAVAGDGKAWCWGEADYGALGAGSITPSLCTWVALPVVP